MTAEPRLEEPHPNTITRPYRGLSVQDVDIPLTPARVEALLRRREIYRRTAYLVLRNEPDTALVAVGEPGPAVLAGGGLRGCRAGHHRGSMIPPRTSATPRRAPPALAPPGQRAPYVVEAASSTGIGGPAPLTIGVTEVIATLPKLLAMAEQVIAFETSRGQAHARRRRRAVAGQPAPRCLLPCCGSVYTGREVSFLDYHPPYHRVAADRLRTVPPFHQHFGAEPAGGLAPTRGLPARRRARQVLPERGVQVDGATAVVPWAPGRGAPAIQLCGLLAARPGPSARHWPAPGCGT
jgi:hypothetical protein